MKQDYFLRSAFAFVFAIFLSNKQPAYPLSDIYTASCRPRVQQYLVMGADAIQAQTLSPHTRPPNQSLADER